MIALALEQLGIFGYTIDGEPTTEAEFNATFKRVVGEDTYGSAIFSNKPQDFGVTWKQIQDEIVKVKAALPLNDCKAEAKKRIAATDWSVLSDVGISNTAEFEAYRAALRELIKNPVADPVWDSEPEPIWI
jgi:hypothetical protein